MEHLLLPRGAVLTPDERAQYIAEPYDNGPFLTYPQRSQFKHLYEKMLPDGDLPRYHEILHDQEMRKLEVFFQTWLLFGLLYEVFGEKAAAHHFVVEAEDDGVPLISTSHLNDIAAEWIVQHYHLEERGMELLEHLLQCILETHQAFTMVREKLSFNRTILCTIVSVAETLEELILETLDKGTRSLFTVWNAYSTSGTARLMIDQGWCPSDVKQWQKRMPGFQEMLYLSKIKQPKIKDHSRCDGQDCVANQYNSSKQPQHRCADGNCGSISVNVTAVVQALADGYIALLDITIEAGELKIEVLSSKEHTTYVALSHVWANGLGNPDGNALVRCQLEYVAQAVQNFAQEAGQKKILVWLDTLCCPVKSPPHRVLCIMRMRQIYEDAAYVLVLDAALSHYTSDELDCVELTARLMYSSWTRRLWTLQEGALARNLWVQLKDKAVNMDAISMVLQQRYQTEFTHSPLLTPLYSNLHRLRHSINPTDVKQETELHQLRSAVESRSVSVASDEPLCLATFLALDQQRIAQSAADERMKVFWETFGQTDYKLAKNIVFFAGTRLSNPGYRWSPSTFLSAVHLYNLRRPKSVNELATIHQRGLRADFPAFELKINVSEVDNHPWDDIFKAMEAACYVRRAEGMWYMLFKVPSTQASQQLTVIDLLVQNNGHNIILLEKDLHQPSQSPAQNNICAALIVSTLDAATDEPLVHASETVHIFRQPLQQTIILEASWQLSQDRELQASLQPFVKPPDEVSVRADEATLSRLPNTAVIRLQHLASIAIQNATLAACFQGSVEKRRDDLMGRVLLFFTGRCAVVERTWESSQSWCID